MSPFRTSVGFSSVTNMDTKQDEVVRGAFQHRNALVAYATALLGNHAAAEDVVQEAFLVVVRKADSFTEGTSLLAWCRAIVRLEILRQRGRWKKEMTLTDRLLHDAVDTAFEKFQRTEAHAKQTDRHQRLHACVAKLPDRGRKLLQARFIERKSYQETATHLDMNVDAVHKSLVRLKKQLKACMQSAAVGEAS